MPDRRAAGERQEHLVEAGLADREVAHADPDAGQLGQGPADALGHLAGAVPGGGDAGPERGRVALGVHRDAEFGSQDALGLCSLGGHEQPYPHGARADRRLQLAAGAFGDHPAVVDHGDPVGQLVGFVEVLRGEQHGRAAGDDRAHDLPDLVAAARVQAGGRLVQEQQVRSDDDAGRDVEAAAHAAGQLRDQAPGRVLQIEDREQVVRALSRPAAGLAEQPGEQHQVLQRGQFLVDGRELGGQADLGADGGGVIDDVVAEHPCRAGVGPRERGEDADRGGLAGPLGPSTPYTMPREIARSTPSTAQFWPKDLVSPDASTANSPASRDQ